MNVKEKDQKYFGRGSAAMELEVEKAQGSLIWDTSGKKYIDFLGGAGVGNLGWAKEEIEMSIRNSARPTYVYPNFYYKPWADLAELLASITPEHLTTSFRTTGGSESIEGAMQIAMMYTGRKKFLSLEGSYHGNTLGALSIGASANKEKFHNLLPGCEKIETPLDSEALKKIEIHLQNNEVAAFIMEPIVSSLGMVIPDGGFMKKLDSLCKKHGTLLVMDEVVTGLGRTGKFFGTEHFDIKPDILCLAKALSAGHAGIGAVMTSDKIAKAVEGKIGLFSTYGWHPLSVDAAITNIRYLLENTEELFDNIEKTAAYFQQQLSKMPFPSDTEIRIMGAAIGVDVKDEEFASEIKKKGLDHGLLMNTEGATLVFLPALNIDQEIVKEGLQILRSLI